MQIHELNSFSGTPSSTDYLVIDDGTDTSKISAEDLLSGVTSDVEGLRTDVSDLQTETANLRVLVMTISNVSSLPISASNSGISSDHIVIGSVLSNPAAQVGDWTVTTSSGSLTISGSISGTTDVTLYLALQRA